MVIHNVWYILFTKPTLLPFSKCQIKIIMFIAWHLMPAHHVKNKDVDLHHQRQAQYT